MTVNFRVILRNGVTKDLTGYAFTGDSSAFASE